MSDFEPDREDMMPAIEIDGDDVPVRLSGRGETRLTGDAESPPADWGSRVSQGFERLPHDRLATMDERVAAARLRIAGWDVVPAWDVLSCGEPYDSGVPSMECNIELRHFGPHLWLAEGSACMDWPQ